MTKEGKSLVALEIRLIRGVGVHRVRIFSYGSRKDGFDFYWQLLHQIEGLSRAAKRSCPRL
jgi:hypothetical protein